MRRGEGHTIRVGAAAADGSDAISRVGFGIPRLVRKRRPRPAVGVAATGPVADFFYFWGRGGGLGVGFDGRDSETGDTGRNPGASTDPTNLRAFW